MSSLVSAVTRSLTFGAALAATVAIAALATPPAAAQTPPAPSAPTLRVGGTGSALGTIRLLGEAIARHDPGFRLTVVPNLGSGGGLRALQAGAIDLALISRPLKPEESAAGLVAYEYGRSPFVLVSSRTAASALTRAELAAMLDGSHTQWADGMPVRLVLRPLSDNDNALLAAMSPQVADGLKRAHSRSGLVIAMTDQDAVDEAERLPGSLATSTLALLLSEGRKAQALALDGVQPSAAALAAGRYPYFKPLLAVTRGAGSPAAQQLLAALQSAEGRALLESTGHVVPR